MEVNDPYGEYELNVYARGSIERARRLVRSCAVLISLKGPVHPAEEEEETGGGCSMQSFCVFLHYGSETFNVRSPL